LFDLNNTQQVPPNNVTFTVSSVVNTEDYVLVGPANAGNLELDQLSLSTALTATGQTSVVVSSAIPIDTPASGTIRVELDDGRYRRVSYTSWSGSTFTTASTDWDGTDTAASGNNVFISYIDKVSDNTFVKFTTKYNADRDLFVRVRDGGGTPIKTFETPATLSSSGGSVAAIRTSDA
jgi:hypothetical protein